MRQGIRRTPPPWGLSLLVLLGALPASAFTMTAEGSASKDARALTLLGDVELRKNETFLTFGYSALRPQPDTALSHQFSLGMDQAVGDHWLVSGSLLVGLPNTTTTPLAQERPRLGLPALAARTSTNNQGLNLSAGYDSAGLSDVEYGLDASLGVTRYPLRRAIIARQSGQEAQVAVHELDQLWVLRPSLGARLMLGSHWELGLRGGVYLYNEDPLSAGQFTEEEQRLLAERYAQVAEDRALQRVFLQRLYREIGTVLATRLDSLNATTGLPSAPARFDVKPTLTYRFNTTVRAQLSYVYTHYVPTQGYGQVFGTRWTFRLAESFRFWAAVSLQEDVPEDADRVYTGLATLGAEYTF